MIRTELLQLLHREHCHSNPWLPQHPSNGLQASLRTRQTPETFFADLAPSTVPTADVCATSLCRGVSPQKAATQFHRQWFPEVNNFERRNDHCATLPLE